MRLSALAFVAAFSALTGVASADVTPTPDVAQQPSADAAAYPVAVNLPAGEYRLDPRHTSVLFRIRHEGLAWFTARFDTKDATLTLDPNDPSHSQLSASVEAASVNTGVLSAQGERVFDHTIARALGADQTPTITFVSTSIERTGPNTGRITGDLTLNGQTHPATLDATFVGDTSDLLRGGSRVLGFSAQGTIDRTDWGVNDWRAFTGAEVQIIIEAEFVKD